MEKYDRFFLYEGEKIFYAISDDCSREIRLKNNIEWGYRKLYFYRDNDTIESCLIYDVFENLQNIDSVYAKKQFIEQCVNLK